MATEVGESLGLETTAREAETGEDGDSYEPGNAMSGEVERRPTVKPQEFWKTLGSLLDKSGHDWKNLVDKVWSFGPYHSGPNILFDRREGVTNSCVRSLSRGFI